MDRLSESPITNDYAMLLAKLLRGAKNVGNKLQIPESVPLVGGKGAGDLLLGKAPEEVENWSYGNMPFAMPPSGTGGYIPIVKTGRKEGLADAIGMLPGGMGGASGEVGQATAANIMKILRAPKTPEGVGQAAAANAVKILRAPRTPEGVVRSILGDAMVHVDPNIDPVMGQVSLGKTWVSNRGQPWPLYSSMDMAPGEGGAIGLASMNDVSPEALTQAAHEARHAWLHTVKKIPEAEHDELRINKYVRRWLDAQGFEPEDLARALREVQKSDDSYSSMIR